MSPIKRLEQLLGNLRKDAASLSRGTAADKLNALVVADNANELEAAIAALTAAKARADAMTEVLAYMLGCAEVDCLDDNSNEWRTHMNDARSLLDLKEPPCAPS